MTRLPATCFSPWTIGPDVAVAGQPDTCIDFIHRTTPEADCYFLANRNGRADKTIVTFPQAGHHPELWNPVDGSQRDLSQFTIKDGHTSVPLTFEPHGSMFIVFRKPVAQTVFSFTKNDADTSRHWLDLGEVHIAAKVRLNGIDLGVAWCHPWRVDASKALRNGVNQLEIEVVNQWPNRLIGDGRLPGDQRRTRTNISRYYKPPRTGEHRLLPSGLVGPVRSGS